MLDEKIGSVEVELRKHDEAILRACSGRNNLSFCDFGVDLKWCNEVINLVLMSIVY